MRRRDSGFTLIELMIVVTVMTILFTIALPTYRSYIVRGNRTDAKTALFAMAEGLERCFTRFNDYSDAACTVDVTAVPSINGSYLVSAVVARTTFTLTATPQAGQAHDTDCANFTLDNANRRGVTGTKAAAACWGG